MPTVNHGNGLVFDDFSNGVLDDLSVADSLMPRNAVRKGVNCMFDRPRGAISQRLGTTKVGGDVESAKTIKGVYNFKSSANSSYDKLLASANGTLYYLNGAVWTSTVASLNAAAKMRFITYLNRVVFLNGVDQPQAWTGNGAWEVGVGGTLDVANWPITKYATLLNGRIFAAGNTTNPSRLYASSIVSSSAISWTSGNKTIDVFPNDGSGDFTGLAGNGRVILLFKDRAMFRYDDNSLDHIGNIGTPSNESIVTDDNGVVYFFGQGANGVGFYKTTGGFPVKISRPVMRWVEAISASSYANVAGYTDGKKIIWSVGSVVIGDTTYSNACLVYNVSDQTWEQRNYSDSFRVFSQYIDSSGTLFVVGGDTDGMVQKMDIGNTDNAAPIVSECEFGPMVLSERGRTKKINEFWAYSTHFQGLDLLLKIDGGTYQKVGSVTKRVQEFKSTSFRGNTFYPKITAVNSGTPFQFDGFNFVKWGDEGYV